MDSLFAGRGVWKCWWYLSSNFTIYYDKVINEYSKSNYYDKLSGMLGNVESVLKRQKERFSVDLNRYFQSIENLRTNPNSGNLQKCIKNEGF